MIMSSNIIEININNAYENLKSMKDAYLIDVRTESEWQSDGIPDTSGLNNDLIKLTITLQGGLENPHFLDKIQDLKLSTNDHLYFICRSGVRSAVAAQKLSFLGYKNLYNIMGGFSFGWLDHKYPYKKNFIPN